MDEVGEILIAGSSVSPGYWNKPELTAEICSGSVPDYPGMKFLRSGDLGFFHEGELFVSERLKDMIIIHGRNIYPQDIEFFAECSHPALRPNASAAFSVDVENVCDNIRANIGMETELSAYAIQLIRTASILKTSSGKIQRKACKEAFLGNKLDVVGESFLEEMFYTKETGTAHDDLESLEAWLMSWVHVHLKIPLANLDLSRPITAFGLSSMKAIALQQDFLNNYGVNFPPYLFFEKISMKELCSKALILMKEN